VLELEGIGSVKKGEVLALPSLAELLALPALREFSIDDAYKYGGESIRHLIDNIPLTNKKKYINVGTAIQLLSPSACSIISHETYSHEWHVDGYSCDNPDYYHLLVSDCTALTEFASEEIMIAKFYPESVDLGELNHHLNNYENIEPVAMSPNTFHTFSTFTVHRATLAKKVEFRYMFRVIESDFSEPRAFARDGTSFVYRGMQELNSVFQGIGKTTINRW
jgi:hypothetical protein